ncbi:MAG: DUF3800 domain-containing protein [Proteobacteria bacterium]|nr:DUF3800 domain-containing protein [Pseudomonadota bacterium]
MIISIDESGSFVNAEKYDSWNCVAAFVCPERMKSKSVKILNELKTKSGIPISKEIKLKNISENRYFTFLSKLSKLNVAIYSAVTDAGRNSLESVIEHRKSGAVAIRKNIPNMKYESMGKVLSKLADDIEALPPQLYFQLTCQIHLFADIIRFAPVYFVQRDNLTLRRFKWRIDQKNSKKSVYEKAFDMTAGAFLQSISLREPMIMLEGQDYTHMSHFEYAEGEESKYLQEQYGIETKNPIDLSKIIGNREFVDSKDDQGVQISDLIASGIRRGMPAT